MGFAASSQMSFRIRVEGRQEVVCNKRFEGRRQGGGGNASSIALKGSRGEAGILNSIEGFSGRHVSRALKGVGGGMHQEH